MVKCLSYRLLPIFKKYSGLRSSRGSIYILAQYKVNIHEFSKKYYI